MNKYFLKCYQIDNFVVKNCGCLLTVKVPKKAKKLAVSKQKKILNQKQTLIPNVNSNCRRSSNTTEKVFYRLPNLHKNIW